MTEDSLQVSLVMTVLNEGPSINRFLESLVKQEVLPDEMVITDGGSTDDTVEILESWGSRTPFPLSVIVKPDANISVGRNWAIASSRGKIVAVTDAGTHLGSNWLTNLCRPLLVGGADVSGGFFAPGGLTAFERFLGAVTTPTLDEIVPEKFLPSSRSVAFTRDAWANSGGYPEWLDYCEDLVFDLELKRNGCRFAFAPEALVEWNARPDIRAFFRQYYRYARGDGKAGLWPKRHLVRYSAYLAGILLLSLSVWEPVLLLILLIGFMVYMAKYARRLMKRWPSLPLSAKLMAPVLPVVVVLGDIAKMGGYPAGLVWRATRGPKVGRLK